MSKKPLVSVIIPNFNNNDYIEQTVQSVLEQTYDHFEIIIIDDHSSDGGYATLERLSSTDHRIKIAKTDKNSGGPATPRNEGLALAQGDFIAFLDSDDIWERFKLDLQIDYMLRHDVAFTSTLKKNFKMSLKATERNLSAPKVVSAKKLCYSQLLKKNLVNTSTVVLRKELLNGLGFNTSRDLAAIEDFNLWLEVTKAGHLVHRLNHETIYYRLTGNNISSNKLKMAKKFWMVQGIHVDSFFRKICNFLYYATSSIIYMKVKR